MTDTQRTLAMWGVLIIGGIGAIQLYEAGHEILGIAVGLVALGSGIKVGERRS